MADRKSPTIEDLVTDYKSNLEQSKENSKTGWKNAENKQLLNKVIDGIDRAVSIYRASKGDATTPYYKIRETLYGDLTPEEKFKNVEVEEGTVYFYILPDSYVEQPSTKEANSQPPSDGGSDAEDGSGTIV